MGINGITNLNQYAAMQMVKTQVSTQSKTAAVAGKATGNTGANTQATKPAVLDDLAKRIASIPDLEKYKGLIQRFISGESEMERAGKPLTEDQIALREFMREFHRTDTRTPSEIQEDMRKASNAFNSFWQSSGNTGPRPGRLLSADGSIKTFNSKGEKDEFMRNNTLSFLESVMSVINAEKSNGNLDVTV